MNFRKRNVWLIAPHFPPSNLVAGHRVRMMANHMTQEGWQATILTVKTEFYEEELEEELLQLVDPSVRVVRVPAWHQKWSRRLGVGDLGIRAWNSMRRVLMRAAENKEIDLLHISMPSNYPALLGPILWKSHRVPYLLDYQDPWVPESHLQVAWGSKLWVAFKLARIFEPRALKYVSGLMAIAPGYLNGVKKRHPKLKEIPQLMIQNGFSLRDHEVARRGVQKKPWITSDSKVYHLVYAGAFLPKAGAIHATFLRALGEVNRSGERNFRVTFIGTGTHAKSGEACNLRPIAEQWGVSGWVVEHPARKSYLEILRTLDLADGILIVGSNEPHYSPSKIFQAVMAKKKIVAVLHQESEAVSLLRRAGIGGVATFGTQVDHGRLQKEIERILTHWDQIQIESVDPQVFTPYESHQMTRHVLQFYERVLGK